MVPLLFGDGSDPIHKVERLYEIGEGESSGDVVLVDSFPVSEIGELRVDFGEFLSLEGWNAAAARYAGSGSQFSHESSVAKMKVSGTIHEMQSQDPQFSSKTKLAQARARASHGYCGLEGNIFVADGGRHRRCSLMLGRALVEVVAPRSSARISASFFLNDTAATEKHEIIGHDFGHVSLLTGLLVVPRTGLELAFDVNLAAFL